MARDACEEEPSSATAIRQRVLDSTGELLVRSSPASLTVRAVAAQAGCSTMMIYTLFGGKEPLLEAVYLDAFERLQTALDSCSQESDAIERLRRLAHAYRSFGLANRTLYAAMFSQPIASARLSGTQARRQTQSFALLVEAVRYARDMGALPMRYSLDIVADSLWSVVHGHVSLEVSGHFDDANASSKRFEALVDVFLTGLSAEPAPKRRTAAN